MATDQNTTARMHLATIRASAQRIVRLLQAVPATKDQSEAIVEAQAIDLAGGFAIDGLTAAASALGDVIGDI